MGNHFDGARITSMAMSSFPFHPSTINPACNEAIASILNLTLKLNEMTFAKKAGYRDNEELQFPLL
jgi:hypothetical protein